MKKNLTKKNNYWYYDKYLDLTFRYNREKKVIECLHVLRILLSINLEIDELDCESIEIETQYLRNTGLGMFYLDKWYIYNRTGIEIVNFKYTDPLGLQCYFSGFDKFFFEDYEETHSPLPISIDGKYGYITAKSCNAGYSAEVIMPPIFDDVMYFGNELYVGVIDESIYVSYKNKIRVKFGDSSKDNIRFLEAGKVWNKVHFLCNQCIEGHNKQSLLVIDNHEFMKLKETVSVDDIIANRCNVDYEIYNVLEIISSNVYVIEADDGEKKIFSSHEGFGVLRTLNKDSEVSDILREFSAWRSFGLKEYF